MQARGLAELIEHHVDNSPGLLPLSAHSTRLTEDPGAGQTVHSSLQRSKINSNKWVGLIGHLCLIKIYKATQCTILTKVKVQTITFYCNKRKNETTFQNSIFNIPSFTWTCCGRIWPPAICESLFGLEMLKTSSSRNSGLPCVVTALLLRLGCTLLPAIARSGFWL